MRSVCTARRYSATSRYVVPCVRDEWLRFNAPFCSNCTRLYFDFLPHGEMDAVRGCHIDRRSPDELQASLPAQGTLVTVRYLPHEPRRAVIGKLIS